MLRNIWIAGVRFLGKALKPTDPQPRSTFTDLAPRRQPQAVSTGKRLFQWESTGWAPCWIVLASTKSEARAALKRTCGIRAKDRLPIGVGVKKVGFAA